jgi:hypothetical protein
MLLFRSEEHATRWYEARGSSTGAFLSVDQGWNLARTWYADRMSPDWRRPAPQQAEALFARLGLTGEFWRLSP